MNMELYLSIAAALLSATSLLVSILKRRKPTLAAAAARGALYGKGVGGTQEEQILHACHAVIREDMGDNGKRDWPDIRIRQEVQAHFR
jgi:hypothetical protein